MSHNKLAPLVEGAIFAALGAILSYISISYAQTFYVEIAIIPVLLYSLRRGPVWGMVIGLVFGLLCVFIGRAEILSPLQCIFDNIFAPIFIGVAGFLKPKKANQPLTLSRVVLAMFAGSLAKYFWHIIGGVAFWSAYTWKGWGAIPYSIVTQGTSGIATGLAAAIIAALIYKSVPQLFTAKN